MSSTPDSLGTDGENCPGCGGHLEDDHEHYYDCNYCQTSYCPATEFRAGFCSRLCKHSKDAEDILIGLTHDHRYCATCFTKIRDTYPPSRSGSSKEVLRDDNGNPTEFRKAIPECAIGTAHPRPETVPGLAEKFVTKNPVDDDWEPQADGTMSRMVCECGVTHHGTIWRPNPVVMSHEIADTLSQAITDQLHEERHDFQHDFDTLKRELSGPMIWVGQEQFIHAVAQSLIEWSP